MSYALKGEGPVCRQGFLKKKDIAKSFTLRTIREGEHTFAREAPRLYMSQNRFNTNNPLLSQRSQTLLFCFLRGIMQLTKGDGMRYFLYRKATVR